MFTDKTTLITGGTGSFGKQYVKTILERYRPKKLIIYSRDELKQFEMEQEYHQECMRYFIGDVRDRERLVQAMNGVDYVIHAAALKQVPAAEYNPMEYVKTNILGSENVMLASINAGVKKVVVIMEHSAKNEAKLLKKCNLPLTGAGVVDMVITDLGVFTIDRKGGGGMTLIELAPDVTLDEIKSKTEASYKVALKPN